MCLSVKKLPVLLFILFVSSNAYSAALPDESARLTTFLEESFAANLKLYPEFQTLLGFKTDNDKWDTRTDRFAMQQQERRKHELTQLLQFDPSRMSDRSRLFLRIVRYDVERDIANFKWRFHNYPVNQMNSEVDDLAALLINFHQVDSVADANAYIARIKAVPKVIDELLDGLRIRERKKVIPPKFVFGKVIENLQNQLRCKPITETKVECPLLLDFRKKVSALDIKKVRREKLVQQAQAALTDQYAPALKKVVRFMTAQEKKATTDDGVWKLPDGAAYYNRRLENWTTTSLTAEQIHQRGLAEVQRIEDEMRQIMAALKYDGDLRSFFRFLRQDPRFYYPNTDTGREQYLAYTRKLLAEISGKLDDYFVTRPKAGLIVKRVEAFREKNTSAAFYTEPSIDGTRPGIYYVPLHDMQDMPTWDLATTAYHEGIPGHHMQGTIALELRDVPMVIREMWNGAYGEGWALYAEYLAKEIGQYEGKPYEDFGRLSAELFRAVRLVVDTGIHAKHWNRQQAIDYMLHNTPTSLPIVTGEIERYIVWPGQATSYKIGEMKILELRRWAKQQLGSKFDIRQFHEVVLTSGALPLQILESQVRQWVASQER